MALFVSETGCGTGTRGPFSPCGEKWLSPYAITASFWREFGENLNRIMSLSNLRFRSRGKSEC